MLSASLNCENISVFAFLCNREKFSAQPPPAEEKKKRAVPHTTPENERYRSRSPQTVSADGPPCIPQAAQREIPALPGGKIVFQKPHSLSSIHHNFRISSMKRNLFCFEICKNLSFYIWRILCHLS